MAFAQHTTQPVRGSFRYAAPPASRRLGTSAQLKPYAEWSRLLGYAIDTVVIAIGALAAFIGLARAIPKGSDYGGSNEINYSGVALAVGGLVLVAGLQLWNRYLRPRRSTHEPDSR